MGLYTSDIGWGRWLNIVHETVRRRWFGVALAVSLSRHGILPPLLVAASCGDARRSGLFSVRS